MRLDPLLALIVVFVPVSLTSIGGGASTVAEVQHAVVDVHHWANSSEFLNFFAISRAAPGPGMMLATVVGWHVAGWLGALTATLALFIPSSLLCISVVKLGNNYRDQKWHRAMREGLAPVGVGLIIAGVITLFRLSGGGLLGIAIAFASGAVLFWFPRFPALLLLILGALIAAVASVVPF